MKVAEYKSMYDEGRETKLIEGKRKEETECTYERAYVIPLSATGSSVSNGGRDAISIIPTPTELSSRAVPNIYWGKDGDGKQLMLHGNIAHEAALQLANGGW